MIGCNLMYLIVKGYLKNILYPLFQEKTRKIWSMILGGKSKFIGSREIASSWDLGHKKLNKHLANIKLLGSQ
jgi:hypothetical protein